jgi:hypothetical protein
MKFTLKNGVFCAIILSLTVGEEKKLETLCKYWDSSF